MTAAPVQHPEPPWVELHVRQAISPRDRLRLAATNATAEPQVVWTEALLSYRMLVIGRVREELLKQTVLDDTVIRRALDTAWQLYFPMLNRATGPMIAEAYIRAFRNVQEGDVPIKMIYNLADEHARRVGGYFHQTSSDALIQGFNTHVNRRVPQKAALERVLDAYGLTPRQMSGTTSAKFFDDKVESSVPRQLKQRLKSYIGKSIRERLKIFATQESHNLNEQANQVAWMWLVEKGKLPKTAEKQWITARDEKVCAICGPLHRMKVPVSERFILDDGQKLYVPGAHVNCRCEVRLVVNPFEEFGKADNDFDERKHVRDARGRFARKPGGPEPQRQRQPSRPGRETRFAEARQVSPELERMLREASELADAERTKQIAEAALPEISERVSLEPKEKLDERVSLDAPVSLEPVRTDDPVSLAGASLKAHEHALDPTKNKLLTSVGSHLNPSTRNAVKLDMKRAVDFWDKEAKEREKRRPIRRRRVRDAYELDEPVYGVVPYFVVDHSRSDDAPMGSVYIDDDVYLTTAKRGDLEEQAFEEFDRSIEDLHQELMSQGRHILTVNHPRMGELTARLSEEQVFEVLSYASMGTPRMRWEPEDDFIEVEWMDRDGALVETPEVPNRLQTQEAVQMMGVDPEEFEIVMVQTSAIPLDTGVRESERGEADIWRGPGRYRIVGEKLGEDFAVPVRLLILEPIVPEKMVETDWNEPEVIEGEIEDDGDPWQYG